MTVENETSNEATPKEGEETALAREKGSAEVTTRETVTEEKKLRIVLQVEVKAEIDEVDGKVLASANKISVVSEHIRAVIRVIGGGDLGAWRAPVGAPGRRRRAPKPPWRRSVPASTTNRTPRAGRLSVRGPPAPRRLRAPPRCDVAVHALSLQRRWSVLPSPAPRAR